MGMTLKQYARRRFLRLVELRNEGALELSTEDGKAKFLAASVALHAAKAGVPKSWWPLANKFPKVSS